MKNNIKSISKMRLIMLISLGTLLHVSYIPIFAEDKQQQQEQNATIASDVIDVFTFFKNLNVTESPIVSDNATIASDVIDVFTFFKNLNVTESPIVSDNATIASTDYNFIAVGDWYCNEETKKTINNIITQHPELIITTGDHVKESPSAACWIQMSEPIKDKMKIAIGNHDAEFANIYKQIVDYHQLKNPYYSHDFKNIHFISLSTEHPFEEGSMQYEFIKNDLEKSFQNPDINWIVVHQHKPLYSTKQDKKEAEQLRDTYQQLFQQYDVDLVISSHNQYYERTYPILYNENYEKITDKKTELQPIITDHSQSEYPPTDGIVFLTVGTAGDKLDPVKEKPNFYVVQESQFGFLNVKIENNGKTLKGEFHTNNGEVIDYFKLNTT